MTSERFEAASLVICTDEITDGGDSGDLKNRMTATNATTATRPAATSHFATALLG